MVAIRYALNRCCCDEIDVVLGFCPCLLMTLPLTKDLTVSGVVMEDDSIGTPYPDINTDYTLDKKVPPQRGPNCGNRDTQDFIYAGVWDAVRVSAILTFTRLNNLTFGVMSWFPGGSIGLAVNGLPDGVKALVQIEGRGVSAFTSHSGTWALFYKILDVDPDASIDCDVDLTTFTYEKQVHARGLASETPPYASGPGKVFDASSATISYG